MPWLHSMTGPEKQRHPMGLERDSATKVIESSHRVVWADLLVLKAKMTKEGAVSASKSYYSKSLSTRGGLKWMVSLVEKLRFEWGKIPDMLSCCFGKMNFGWHNSIFQLISFLCIKNRAWWSMLHILYLHQLRTQACTMSGQGLCTIHFNSSQLVTRSERHTGGCAFICIISQTSLLTRLKF